MNSKILGHPGLQPRWTSSNKMGVGTSATNQCRVWFTIADGIITEAYYPNIDQANVRDLEFLISDGSSFFSEEKKDTKTQIFWMSPGVPCFRIINTCLKKRFRITKIIFTDPIRDALIQKVDFEPIKGKLSDYHLYTMLAPHVNNKGYNNDGWVGKYRGIPMLFAQREDTSLALSCSVPFNAMSCGYVGFNDGWQDISKNKQMTLFNSDVQDGNIALTGQIDLTRSNGHFLLVLAFGHNMYEAGQRARSALMQDFNQNLNNYINEWKNVQSKFLNLNESKTHEIDIYRVSTAVLKAHESKRFPGGIIASLSIPWGYIRGDDDLGGYHIVWPRDLVETAGALLAADDYESARQTLLYLMSTQEDDGHWLQNMWLDGRLYWKGIQMDETAFPILLANMLRKMNRLDDLKPWQMIRKAASFLVCNGPVTQQGRWEEDGGYSPFTLSVEIAALLAASDFAEKHGEKQTANYLRQTADIWNDNIERWTYVTDTNIAHRVGVEGYYVRVSPPDVSDAVSPLKGFVPIKNRTPEHMKAPLAQIVSPDALALVRFGLRAPNDIRIINTVKVIDSILKSNTNTGPVWHRYNQDGYGEHVNGEAFDGSGVGRGWPLLAGERAHYELANGNIKEAKKLKHIIELQTSPGGLIPEQVWDSPDLPEYRLFNGHPSGSAMPLVWAHAEYIKLLRSLHDEKIFDLPDQTVQRYQKDKIISPYAFWRFNHKVRSMYKGKILRIEVLSPAILHWSTDNWQTNADEEMKDSSLGVYFIDLPTDKLPVNTKIVFTFRWLKDNRWENKNYEVIIKKK